MKLFKTAVVITAVLLSLTGCDHTQPRQPASAVSGTYYFHRFNDKITADSTVALLSYLSSKLYVRGAAKPFESINEMEYFISDYFDTVVASGVISSNYAVKATAEEIHIARVFTDRWVYEVKQTQLSTTAAYWDFRGYVITFINAMQVYEYEESQ